ncbi:hypothetical protein N9F93_00015 [bacterium]|nr:hypothetical protein [bacterium]
MAIIDYNNGTATISINGGQAPFSYLLLQNGTAVTHPGVNFQNPIVSSNNSVVFGDASDLTGSYGISSGTYTCQITDDLGCVVTTSEIVVGQTQEATTTTLATTPATTLLQEYISLTVDQSPVNEGLNVLFTLTSSNIPNNTMVDWSISGSIDSNDISGGLAGTFTIVNNQAQYLATIETDNLLEGQEELTLTLAAIDTNGISAGLSVDVIINDMNTAATTLATTTLATTLATTTLATTLATTTLATTLATTTLATTEATQATTQATTQLPTFDCDTAGPIVIPDGITNEFIDINSITLANGTVTAISPLRYLSGVNTFQIGIEIPSGYYNGGSITCTADATGIDPTTPATTSTTLATTTTTQATTSTTQATTTLATTTTTLATTTTAAPLKGYYLHGGNQAYPYAQGEGLTANPTGTLYYDDGSNAYADTTDLSVAMTYLMDLGTITGAGGYTIQEFDIAAGGITSMGTSDALQFPASTQAEFYYVILPDTEVDLTSVSPQHLVNGGIETNAIQRMPFTWNSTGYYIYKIGGGSQSGALTITFSDND